MALVRGEIVVTWPIRGARFQMSPNALSFSLCTRQCRLLWLLESGKLDHTRIASINFHFWLHRTWKTEKWISRGVTTRVHLAQVHQIRKPLGSAIIEGLRKRKHRGTQRQSVPTHQTTTRYPFTTKSLISWVIQKLQIKWKHAFSHCQ